jgi:hypothetical protein
MLFSLALIYHSRRWEEKGLTTNRKMQFWKLLFMTQWCGHVVSSKWTL